MIFYFFSKKSVYFAVNLSGIIHLSGVELRGLFDRLIRRKEFNMYILNQKNKMNNRYKGNRNFILLILCLSLVSSFSFAEDMSTKPLEKSIDIKKPDSLLQRIVNSYVNSSNTDKTLKHLLDAKMYLSTAEHDLLVSHDKQQAHDNIESSLHFLAESLEVANPANKSRISKLIETLKILEKKTDNKVQAGKDNEVDTLLGAAQETLLKAKEIASPEEVQEIVRINANIHQLRQKIEHVNLRDDYENSMRAINDVINAL